MPRSNVLHRRNLPRIENFKDYVRLPHKKDVLECYQTLLEIEKSKQKKVKIITVELTKLWGKMSFPIISEQAIIARIKKLIAEYEKDQKYPKEEFKLKLDTVFDITKPKGQWLCEEDRKLYKIQIASEGKIGYTTHKLASSSTIHPSKRQRLTKKDNKTMTDDDTEDRKSSSSTTNSDTSSSESYEYRDKQKKHSTALQNEISY